VQHQGPGTQGTCGDLRPVTQRSEEGDVSGASLGRYPADLLIWCCAIPHGVSLSQVPVASGPKALVSDWPPLESSGSDPAGPQTLRGPRNPLTRSSDSSTPVGCTADAVPNLARQSANGALLQRHPRCDPGSGRRRVEAH
jgi:hypothetical protein